MPKVYIPKTIVRRVSWGVHSFPVNGWMGYEYNDRIEIELHNKKIYTGKTIRISKEMSNRGVYGVRTEDWDALSCYLCEKVHGGINCRHSPVSLKNV